MYSIDLSLFTMKKVVFGILASTNEHYSKFIDIWIDNITRFKRGPYANLIDFYFIYNEPDTSKSLIPDNMEHPMYYHYYSKYNENYSMMDSFLNRTVCLLDYLQSTPFDYFIRTNLSTLFQLDMVIQWIQKLPKYNIIAGTPIDELKYIYTYMSGTNIILSHDLVEFVLLNREYLLDEKVLHGDDQRISSLIIENLNVNLLLVKRLDFIEITYNNDYMPPSIVFQSCYYSDNLFCYRFKTKNRENDIKYMKMLQKQFYLENFNSLQFVRSIVNDPTTPYQKIYTQNTDYDNLTYKTFQITKLNNMENYHFYKNIVFKYPSSICKNINRFD